MRSNAARLSLPFPHRWWRSESRVSFKSLPLLPGLLVCVGYYLGARLGFALTLQPQPVSVLWPPNSILLAAFLLTPARWWWFLVLSAAPAHWLSQVQSGVPQAMIWCWFISNCFEAFVGAWGVRRFGGPQWTLDGFRNLGIFLLCGVFAAPFLSSFLDAGLVSLNRFGGVPYWDVWRTRFFSNTLAALTLVTVIVGWRRAGGDGLLKLRRAWMEAAVLFIGLLTVSWFVFVHQTTGNGATAAFLYTPLPFLLWAALRFCLVGTATSMLILVIVSIVGTAHGRGPFSSSSPAQNALLLQLLLVTVAIPLFSLAALIQDRKRIEDSLRSSEERYREVVETQTELICRFLPDTTLTFVNDAYCRFFERRREELIGRRFIELIPESAREQALSHIASLLKDPRVHTIEHEVLAPNGTMAWHHWTNHAIRGPDGQVVEFQSIGRDITDRKWAEEANEKLAHVSRLAMVGELTASIAHEINQPLGAILTNAEAAELLLEADPANIGQMKQILADIRKDEERASDVIRHMRTLLRKRHLEMEVLDINKVASDVLGLIRAEARKRNIACKTEFAQGLPSVKADRVHMEQVLLNFVLNGMDSMAETPEDDRWLTITTIRHESGGVEVAVADAGKGIPADHFAKLFESFFTTKKEGMGLGLFVSRMIVEAYHGQIRAENNVARGATFRVVLPAHDEV